MTDKKHGLCGKRNAAKSDADKRVPITIRLPANLIAALRDNGNVTAQIETAIRQQNGW